MVICSADPASRPATSWRAEFGSLRARGVDDGDERVRDCVAGIAYWRVQRVIAAEADRLSPSGVDLLAAQLLAVSR
ncbi:hypothetical protein [Mycolicibacterium pulveris]|uniref:hypothetical protein n=1 Tax=Mycolicibacterium pulveris TaxID=36813 RepID=UPI003CF6A7F6